VLTMSQSSPSYSPCLTCNHTRCILLAIVLATGTLINIILAVSYARSYSPRRRAHRHPPHSRRAHRVVFILSCSSRRAHCVVLIVSCSTRRAHRVVLIASCSSHRAQRVVSYLPTFLCFPTKCGSSIYRCTLDRMNRTGLSHYAWNPRRVCECDKSICCDLLCLDSQRDRGAMTLVVQTPFALTRQRSEGKCPDTAASRRKMP